ncbi:hypothetical protein QF047_003137 [Arthrobacter sp. W4I7]|nr:hypothetical protein [Arthrobacter sp. W4I7]
MVVADVDRMGQEAVIGRLLFSTSQTAFFA